MATGTTDEAEIGGGIRRILGAERRQRGLPPIPANAPLGPWLRDYMNRGGDFAQGQHALTQRFIRDDDVRAAARRGAGVPRRAPQRGADGRFVQRSASERATNRRTDRQVYAAEVARLLGPNVQVVQGRTGQALVKVGRGRALNPIGKTMRELTRTAANEVLRLRNEAVPGSQTRRKLTTEWNRLRKQAQRLAGASPEQTERRGRRADRAFNREVAGFDRNEHQRQRRKDMRGQ